ncbi:MAG: TetR/AcrR family transcriptional regulator [Bryobacterales bacterium]|nr:TetR/AcrR family transcriptional regulator [Bryobacterales bacterium]
MRGDARTRLLEAARDVIRAQGFAGTSVDDLCRHAEVTKGAFFHHFKSKEELGVAAAAFWATTTSALFAQASYHALTNPLERVLGYIDLRRSLVAGELWQFTCLVGTMVQESFAGSEAIRRACGASIFGHAETLERDLQAAMDEMEEKPTWTAASLARHTQAVIQGAFILAKASNSAAAGRAIALEQLGHLRAYVELLFRTEEERR